MRLRAPAIVAFVAAPALLLLPHWRSDALPGSPRVMLWAWERSEDLRFVKQGAAGIAFLARTVWIDSGCAISRPRLQPLRYAPGAYLMAVVRVESSGQGLPPLADAVREIRKTAELPDVRALQIDFDARASERRWYGELLRELRRSIPPRLPLVMTALVSWCEQDGWIRDLPVADASPMLFQMDPGEAPPLDDFAVPLCRASAGLSMDELPARLPHGRRLYFFASRPWTPESFEIAMGQARRFR